MCNSDDDIPKEVKRTISREIQQKETETMRKSERRPQIVNPMHPEAQHFTNNQKNKNRYEKEKDRDEKPLILLVGDSMIKNVTNYDLRKKCGNARIMVRSLGGAKIKNIENLIKDLLRESSPKAICVHVATNDISDEKSTDAITGEMKDVINLIKEKGIIPIISLITARKDDFSEKVNVINEKLIQLCKAQNVFYIDHGNINKTHLNPGGLHITWQNTYLLKENFADFFHFAVEHNFYFTQ